jgi:hypothetical protein
MVKFNMNALFAAVQQVISQEPDGFPPNLDSQLTQVSPPSEAPSQDEVSESPAQATPPPSVLSSNHLAPAPPYFSPGTLIHTSTGTPSESFIASPGNVILPGYPTRMNKPDPAPTEKKASTTKKKSTKAAIKAANAATKCASSSTSKKKSIIPPRTLSQPSITQTLAEMQEAVTEIKESELDPDLCKIQQFMQQEARADMDNYFGDQNLLSDRKVSENQSYKIQQKFFPSHPKMREDITSLDSLSLFFPFFTTSIFSLPFPSFP